LAMLREDYPRPAVRGTATGRAIVDRGIIHISDIREDPDYTQTNPQARGWRTVLAVPMLRDGEPIGVLGLWRREVRAFSEKQVALISTFADQAVIAIENVRLFKELEARNSDLTEALEQQTATSEILRVISSSPTDIQPVFDAMSESAARLCEAVDAAIFRRDGDHLRLAAHHGPIPVRSTVPLIREEVTGRVAMDGRTVHVADLQSETVEYRQGSENARRLGLRTILCVPLIREEGVTIGTINVRRTEARLFTERQIALLQTFADQAVIAIENVRLFTELQEKNQALTTAHAQVTESLEQQTATSEILRVISESPTDLQPVLDAVADRAAHLCGASDATIRSLLLFSARIPDRRPSCRLASD